MSSQLNKLGDFTEDEHIRKVNNLLLSIDKIKNIININHKDQFINTINTFIENSKNIVSLDTLRSEFVKTIKNQLLEAGIKLPLRDNNLINS
jgi:hypothetical protein